MIQARTHLQLLAGPDGSRLRLWSRYAGFLDYYTGDLPPSFDDMIHALGARTGISICRRSTGGIRTSCICIARRRSAPGARVADDGHVAIPRASTHRVRAAVEADVTYSISNPWNGFLYSAGSGGISSMSTALPVRTTRALHRLGYSREYSDSCRPDKQLVIQFSVESLLPGARLVVTGARLRTSQSLGGIHCCSRTSELSPKHGQR